MIYYWYVTPEKIQFCRIYEKSSQANLSKAEVQQILTELDLTEQDFATLLGVSLATIRKWERGTGEPSGAAKILLAVARLHPEAIREALADGRGVEIEFLSNSEIVTFPARREIEKQKHASLCS